MFYQGPNRMVQVMAPGPLGWLAVIVPAADEAEADRALEELVRFARMRHPDPDAWNRAEADADRIGMKIGTFEAMQAAGAELYAASVPGGDWGSLTPVNRAHWARMARVRAAGLAVEAENKNRRPDEEKPPTT